MKFLFIAVSLILFTTNVHAAWKIETSTDAFDDSKTSTAYTITSNGFFFGLMCEKKKLIGIQWVAGKPTGFGFITEDAINVTYRFDKEEPMQIVSTLVNMKRILVYTQDQDPNETLRWSGLKPHEFVDLMKKHNVINFRMIINGEYKNQGMIDLSGFTSAYNKACK